jgi:hypothetical protein
MRNLIYMCVFRSREYITLFQYLVDSIVSYGELSNDTDVIVLTQSDFEEDILSAAKGLPNVTTRIHSIDTVFECGRSKIRIFEHDVSAYSKILYLDTDILVNEPLKPLFDIDVDPNKLYALEEGVVSHEFWGGETPLFDLTKIDGNTTAFCSGVLLFKNSPQMKQLFSEMNAKIDLDIYVNKIPISGCIEQPYVNYCAIMNGQYDNQALKKFVKNNPITIESGISVYHFPGGPGWHWKKLPVVRSFIKSMKGSRNLKHKLVGKTFHWGDETIKDTITFHENYLLTFFENPRNDSYIILEDNVAELFFGGYYHLAVFNETLTGFTSIRKVDFQITNCRIKNG